WAASASLMKRKTLISGRFRFHTSKSTLCRSRPSSARLRSSVGLHWWLQAHAANKVRLAWEAGRPQDREQGGESRPYGARLSNNITQRLHAELNNAALRALIRSITF